MIHRLRSTSFAFILQHFAWHVLAVSAHSFSPIYTTSALALFRIREITGLSTLTQLTHLYFVHNKITTIKGLDTLLELELLELGDNRFVFCFCFCPYHIFHWIYVHSSRRYQNSMLHLCCSKRFAMLLIGVSIPLVKSMSLDSSFFAFQAE